MIYYSIGILNIFRWRGSVFPKATRAAFPCAFLSACIRFAINEGRMSFMEADDSILTQTQAWAGFSVLVGFLIIFRSSQAYSRFWDGCTATHHMRADWFDAASALVAFTEDSKAPKESIAKFKHTVIRLVSMMNSCAFIDLEEMNNKWGTTSEVKADRYPLLDPAGLDKESLDTLYESKERVMLIFQWLQLLIVRNTINGVLSVPPPILSRAYQELANGMVAFHECVKISDTPFPFPYAQNCELLLVLHWVLVPWVVSQWVTAPFWSFVFVFMQVFVLWSLNYIAVEIENPFGTDDNAIDGAHMQEEMNKHLLMLLNPKVLRTPLLSEKAIWSLEPNGELDFNSRKKSFKDIWKKKKVTKRKRGSSVGSSAVSRDSSGDPGSEEEEDSAEGGDRLRKEAHADAGARCELGLAPPAAGADPSWTVMMKEVGGTTLTEERVLQHERGQLWDQSPPSSQPWDQGRWEAMPNKGPHLRYVDSGPPRDRSSPSRRSARSPVGGTQAGGAGGDHPTTSDDEVAGGRQRGRSGSARRRQEGGGQRRL